MGRREIIPGENFKTGDRIQAYLSEVVMTNRGPEIRLSRTSPLFLVKLFEMEVPEIQDGAIEIKAAAREPGQRAKVAVYSGDKDIDPVGACVGMKGSRVQNVVNELQGEKIDIVKWSPDLETFARSALAPAEINSIMLGENKAIDVVVEEDQLSLAIGRRGQNVRLSAMLTGCNVNIVSKTKLQEKIQRSVENLLQIATLNDSNAQMLVQSGTMNIGDLSAMEESALIDVLEIDEEKAKEILKSVHDAIETGEVTINPEDEEEIVSASAVPSSRCGYIKAQDGASEEESAEKFNEAERRLREELAAFKLK